MTVVIETVANISVPENMGGKKTRQRMQMPSLASTLRKKLYFPILTAKPPVEQPDGDENMSDSENSPNKTEQTSLVTGLLQKSPEDDVQEEIPTPNNNKQTEKQEPMANPAPVKSADGARPL